MFPRDEVFGEIHQTARQPYCGACILHRHSQTQQAIQHQQHLPIDARIGFARSHHPQPQQAQGTDHRRVMDRDLGKVRIHAVEEIAHGGGEHHAHQRRPCQRHMQRPVVAHFLGCRLVGCIGHHEVAAGLERLKVVPGGDDEKGVADFQWQPGDAGSDVHTIAVHGQHHAVVALAEIRLGQRLADQ